METATLLAEPVLFTICQSECAEVQMLSAHAVSLVIVLLLAQIFTTSSNLEYRS